MGISRWWLLGAGDRGKWVICLPSRCSAHLLQRKVILLCCESRRSLFNLRAETEGKMAHLSTTITHGAGAVVDPITKGGTTMLHISTQIIMATTFMHVIENLDLSGLVKDTHWQWVAVTDSRAVHPAGLGHEATEGHRSFCRKRVAVRSSTGAQRRNVVWGRERERVCAKVTPLSTSPGNITCNTLSSQPHLTAISHQLLPCI
ncbi:uncharacterized protein LOC135110845 [Scylla paramamosain]|uniref:uncharacterized protein LOC135110845 n=1 Tax=Scylla paramamosain TaxID=85552 RepID=UPI0030832521